MERVEAKPVFGVFGSVKNYHFGWSSFCPYCGDYWESMDTSCDKTGFCESCGESFVVKYPDNCGLPTFF